MESKMFISKEKIACRRFDGFEVKKVIVANILKGEGTEEDPCRNAKVFFDLDGTQLFELDPIYQTDF